MPDALERVKALAVDYRRFAQGCEQDDPDRSKNYTATAEFLKSVCDELDSARIRLRPTSSDFGDLSDLPPEVVAQLNLSKIDELEQHMRDIIASANGKEVGLDQIIIELYRRHKIQQERRFIMNKLYRMGQKGIVQSVEGRKGVYVIPTTEKDAPTNDADALAAEIPF